MNSINRASADRVATKFASSEVAKNMAANVTVQKFEALNDGIARTVLGYSGPMPTQAELATAVGAITGNKLRFLSNSGIPHTDKSQRYHLITAFVGKNEERKAYEAASVDGFKVIAANVFEDESDGRIWSVQGEGEGRMLVSSIAEDIDALLATKRSLSITTATAGIPLHESFKAGDGVAWYDPAKEAYQIGFAIDDHRVVAYAPDASVENLDVVEVFEDFVVATTDNEIGYQFSIKKTEQIVAKEQAAMPEREPITPANMIKKHMTYMTALYQGNALYLSKLHGLLTTYVSRLA